MKVCVIGGNGFIGSVVVRVLGELGHDVRCTVRKSSKTERLDGLRHERVPGDVRDLDSLKAAFQGCDGVIHLASPSSWNDINSPVLEETVKTGTANVLAAAKDARARLVFCSTIMAVGCSPEPVVFDESSAFNIKNPKFRYSNAKHEAEEMCRKAAAAGQHVVIVNPGEVYGPNDTGLITACNLIDFAKSSPVLVTHGGTAVVHVDDVALGVVRALEKGRSGERYILAGENLTIRQLAEKTLKLLGQQKSIMAVPSPLIKGLTAAAVALHLPLPYNANVVPFATLYWFMSGKKATEELGVKFRSADEALAPTLEWLKTAGLIQTRAKA